MKCFYHSADLDGHCSGAIVKHKFPECEMIGIDYGDKFPWDSIKLHEAVYMVDFSLQPFDQMIELNERCDLIWIDHHKSAIEECKNSESIFFGVQNSDLAACELTWKYFSGDKPPTAVFLLGRYDVWDHSDPNVLPFQYGLRMEENTFPGSPVWDDLFLDEGRKKFFEILHRGRVALEYQKQQNKKIIKSRGFEIELDGLRVIACNAPLTNSQLFDFVWDPEKYDAMLTFSMRPDRQYTISMYTDKPEVDVSEICKARGGGGHKGAAGFQCNELPF